MTDFSHTSTSQNLQDPVTPRDHHRGSITAKAVIVEYGDFECPFCARAVPVLRELEGRFGAELCIVFRHNPRAANHPHAHLAAEAAEAAAEQGKFWEMHDLLFSRQAALTEADLAAYAQTLGLDADRFATAIRTRAHKARVHEDEASGVRNHVISTPTFFVNGVRFDDKPDFGAFARAISQALA